MLWAAGTPWETLPGLAAVHPSLLGLSGLHLLPVELSVSQHPCWPSLLLMELVVLVGQCKERRYQAWLGCPCPCHVSPNGSVPACPTEKRRQSCCSVTYMMISAPCPPLEDSGSLAWAGGEAVWHGRGVG